MAALSTVQEPTHYLQAKGKIEWENAMQEELATLNKNDTWEMVDCPKGKRTIGSKWAFELKLKPNDIKNAFLQGFLDKDIYMMPPDGAPIPPGNSHHEHCLFINHSAAGTSITQHIYVHDIIHDAGLDTCKPISSPLLLVVKLSAHDTDPLFDPDPYRRLVGHLLYLSFTRSDISFGAQQLSQFVHQPGQAHMDATLHLVRYLKKGNPNQGLFFSVSNSSTLTAFCDAGWAGCIDSRRSLSGYCIFLGDALISWKSKKQLTVARSTTEARYRSLGIAVFEHKWISYLLMDLCVVPPTLIPVYCDNQAAIHIIANPIFHETIKHIEIDFHLIHDHYKSGFVLPSYVPSKSQLANVLSKSLPAFLFRSFVFKLGLVSPFQIQLEGGGGGGVEDELELEPSPS
ncbi:UNVERIFIED_CONTAM: Retrovirus-related Pol polyprotein from transposon RE1 [Sesamum angustifolium]|uniref:Retrovirus-related Pol polyprotein from transposon RE1 n=1 Tax=Sesamum angustifolium TaxID=2727405 RepID=A0AAW2RMG4_9LAMI